MQTSDMFYRQKLTDTFENLWEKLHVLTQHHHHFYRTEGGKKEISKFPGNDIIHTCQIKLRFVIHSFSQAREQGAKKKNQPMRQGSVEN